MANESIKKALSKKLATEAEFRAAAQECGLSPYNSAIQVGNRVLSQAWWGRREQLRLEYEVYEQTSVLRQINAGNRVHTHVSLVDPKRVAYTPDRSFGERDAQLTISLGKLLLRLYPGITDSEVQKLVAEHDAEICTDVEFIDGIDKIIEAYYDLGGIAACMSYTADQYASKISPLYAYDVPGVRMAVLRNDAGKITERTLIYEAGPDDLRYIRVYPSNGKLRRRLEKRGYKAGKWHGLEFNRVQFKRTDNDGKVSLLLPYLDGNSDKGSAENSTVALIDDKLVSVSYDMATKLSIIVPGCTYLGTTTSGLMSIRNIDSSEFSCKDYISGEVINLLTTTPRRIKIAGVTYFTTVEAPEGFVSATSYDSSKGQVSVYMLETETCKAPEGVSFMSTYLDRACLGDLGFRMLNAEWYGVDAIKQKHRTVFTDSGHWALKADTVSVLTPSSEKHGGFDVYHKSEIITTGKLRHKKVNPAVYIDRAIKLHTTPSGRQVHPLIHSIEERWDGVYDYRRNLKGMKILGKFVYVDRDCEFTGPGSPVYDSIMATHLAAARFDYEAGFCLMDIAKKLYYRLTDGRRFNGYRWDCAYTDGGREWNLIPQYVESLVEEVRNIRDIAGYLECSASRIVLSNVERLYAEMCAVEAPHYLTTPTIAEVADTTPAVEEPPLVAMLAESGISPASFSEFATQL